SQIFHITHQVRVAVLNPARGSVVAVVPIYHQHAIQFLLAQYLPDHARRARLTVQAQAHSIRAKQPTVAIAAIGPPTGLVRLAHWRLAVFFLQLFERGLKGPPEPMQGLDHRAQVQTEAARDTGERHTLKIVLANNFAEQSIA